MSRRLLKWRGRELRYNSAWWAMMTRSKLKTMKPFCVSPYFNTEGWMWGPFVLWIER